MKRILRTILIGCLLLGALAGCGSADKEDGSPDAGQAALYSRGTWSGSTYASAWTGVSFKIPAGWQVLTDEEIAQLTGSGSGSESIKTTTYDFYITNADDTLSLNMQLYNRKAAKDESLTPEQYLEKTAAVLGQASSVQMKCSTVGESTIHGEAAKCMNITASDTSGNELLMESIQVYEKGQFLVVYTALMTAGSDTSELSEIIDQIG